MPQKPKQLSDSVIGTFCSKCRQVMCKCHEHEKYINELKAMKTDPEHTKLMLRHSILDRKLEESGKYVRPDVMRFLNEAMEEYATELSLLKDAQIQSLTTKFSQLQEELERVKGENDRADRLATENDMLRSEYVKLQRKFIDAVKSANEMSDILNDPAKLREHMMGI